MSSVSPNNEKGVEMIESDSGVITLTETLNPEEIIQKINEQIKELDQAGDKFKPFTPRLKEIRSQIAKALENNSNESEVGRLWTEFWDIVDTLPELGEIENQATIQNIMKENGPQKSEPGSIDDQLETALKDWRDVIRKKGENSPEAKEAEKKFNDLKNIKIPDVSNVTKKPTRAKKETREAEGSGTKNKVGSTPEEKVTKPISPEDVEKPDVYAEEILADVDRREDKKEEEERYEKARKAALAYINGKEEEDLTPLPPPVIDYKGIDSALGLEPKTTIEQPGESKLDINTTDNPTAGTDNIDEIFEYFKLNPEPSNINTRPMGSEDTGGNVDPALNRINEIFTYKSPLEEAFQRAMSASSGLQEVVEILIQFAKATNDSVIIAETTTSIKNILDNSDQKNNDDGRKIESLLEILSTIAPIAYRKERNSSSDKVRRVVHNNGDGSLDTGETPPAQPATKKPAKKPKDILIPKIIEDMGDAAKAAFIETRARTGDTITKEQASEIERIKKAQESVEKIRSNRLERVAKLGIQGFDAIGKNYNKLPTKYKVAISISLLAATIGFGGAAIGAASTGWRVASTAGLYVTIERALAASYSRSTNGQERSRKRKIIHGLEAVAFATLVSFYGGEAIKNIGGEAVLEKIRSMYSSFEIPTNTPKMSGLKLEKEVPQQILDSSTNQIASPEITPEINQLTEAESLANLERMRAIDAAKESASSFSFAHEVSSGDNMYKVLKEYFPEVSNLQGPQQTNLIENILAEIKKNPADYGITSNDVNQLKIGDTIDLEKIQQIIENKQISGKSLIEVAENLSDEAKNRIANYSPTKTIPTLDVSTSGIEAIGGTEITDQKISDTEIGVTDNSNSIHKVVDETPINTEVNTKAPINETLEQIQFKTDLGIKETVETTYGSKGIFGIGKNDGMNIWNNIKGESVDSLPKFKHDSIIPNPEQAVPNTYLQQNYIRQKTEKLIASLIDGVGVEPKEKETIGNFVKRALEKAVSDRINSPKIISTDTLTT